MWKFSAPAASLAALLGLAGCEGAIVEPASPGLEEFKKIGELEASNGNRIEFFEPAPDSYFIIEHASKESPAVTGTGELRGLGPAALYQKLAPGAEVPEQLVRVQAKMDAAPPRKSAGAPQRNIVIGRDTEAGIETAEQALTKEQFSAKYCRCIWGERFSCWTDQSGFNRDEVNDVKYYDGQLNVTKGKVRLLVDIKTWWSWSRKGDVTVNAGEDKRFYFGQAHLDYDLRADITEADGDRYHYRGVSWNGPAQACP